MTWAPNSTFATKLSSLQKRPIYAVQFASVTTVYTTDDVTSPTWTYKKLLRGPIVNGGSIDPRDGRLELGTLSFLLLDDQGEIRSLLSSDKKSPVTGNLAARQLTLYMGFSGMAQANYEVIGVFKVESVALREPMVYEFHCIDPFPELARPLFGSLGVGADTQVATNAGIGATTIYVDDMQTLAVGDLVCLHKPEGGAPRAWTTITARGTDDDGTDPDGDFVTVADALVEAAMRGWVVRKAREIVGNPINIIMRLLLDDFALSGTIQTDFPIDSIRGTFVAGDGCGIASSSFDVTQIKAERDFWLSEFKGRLIVSEREDDTSSFVADFLQGLGFLFVRRAGTIGFRAGHLPLAGTGTPTTLTASQVAQRGWERRYYDLVNRVIVEGNFIGDKKAQLTVIEDAASIAAVGKRETVLGPRWLWSDLGGTAFPAAIAGQWLSRWATGHQQMTFDAHMTQLTLEPGDYVQVTHHDLPDTETTQPMSTTPAEVLSVSPDLVGNKLVLELWRYAGKRGGLICPDAQAAYASASAAERNRYAFVCGDDGFMGDDSPGYTIL